MSEKKQNKKKRSVKIANTIAFIAIAAVLVWAVRAFYHIGEQNFTNDAQVDAYVNPINARVGGYIKEIRFKEHQAVKKGDTLLIIDDRELKTQLIQAEAMLLSAQASKNMTSSSINTVGNGANVMTANAEVVKAQLDNAEINFHRYEKLLQEKSVTQIQFDQVRTQYEALKAQYKALLSQREGSNLSTKEVSKRLDMNAAEIKRMEAALELAKINLAYTVIVAPYDGVVGRRAINAGQLIQPGTPITTIIESNSKWITANFLERQMKNIQPGTKCTITVDALNDKEYEGKVTAISEATGARYSAIPVDNSTGNFVKVQQRIPVHIEFTNKNAKSDLELLRVGMSVELKIK